MHDIYHVCEEQNKNLEVVFPARVCGSGSLLPPSLLPFSRNSGGTAAAGTAAHPGPQPRNEIPPASLPAASYTITTCATHILPAHTVVVVVAVAAVAH